MSSITSWIRLEPRCRKGDLRGGLEARVHDGLWLLARQWQVGEFQGEDTGSPVTARLRFSSTPLHEFSPGTSGEPPTTLDVPLDVAAVRQRRSIVADALGTTHDYRDRAEAGLHFLRMLAAAGFARYRRVFLEQFRFPSLTVPERERLDEGSRRFVELMQGRAPDGAALSVTLADLLHNPPGTIPSDWGVDAADAGAVVAIATQWLSWSEALFSEPPSPRTGWDRERLEHSFTVGAAGGTTLVAPEHVGGVVDWYTCDVRSSAPAPNESTATAIPTPVVYPGMPARRFWELEDADVNLGAIDAAPEDLARLVVAEFALVHGSDWFQFPVELAAGSLARVTSLVVTDTFGQRTLVRSAREMDGASSPFHLYELRGDDTEGPPLFFLPPALPAVLASAPVEEVSFIHDEVANRVWAVEQTVESPSGVRLDRAAAPATAPGAGAPSAAGPSIASVAYRLATRVPAHWMALRPTTDDSGTRLEPAWLPAADGGPRPFQPQGEILTLRAVPEPEVPREGIRVSRGYRHARGVGGVTYLWIAHEKRAVAPLGSSGLQFDVLERSAAKWAGQPSPGDGGGAPAPGASRAMLRVQSSPSNPMLLMFQAGHEAELSAYLQSLEENRPDVLVLSAGMFPGLVPFDAALRGAIAGRADPVLGDPTRQAADPLTGYERLSPAELGTRIDRIRDTVRALHRAGAKRVMPYVHFMSDLFGRHERPTESPESAWGFWEFYDHWESFAKPTGPFELGPKPPDPSTWLRRLPVGARWRDDLPDELAGLSFDLDPVAPEHGPMRRYAACVNTEGWRRWWRQVFLWMARVGYDGAFVDGAYFRSCWEDSCQEAYRRWLRTRYSDAEIARYFTYRSNNLLEDSWGGFDGWCQEVPGQWRTPHWTAFPSETSSISPDRDAVRGRYSARLEGADATVFMSHFVQAIPAGERLLLSFRYRTQGAAEFRTVIEQATPEPVVDALAAADGWTLRELEFESMAQEAVTLYLRFEVTGPGKLWVDDVWLGRAAAPAEDVVALTVTAFDEELLWWQAAVEFWAASARERLDELRRAAREVNPAFEIFANGPIASDADYCLAGPAGLVPELDVTRGSLRGDVGFCPGAHGSPATVITNVFGYRVRHSERLAEGFTYVAPDLPVFSDAGLSPDSLLLYLAEAAAFSGGSACLGANLLHNGGRYSESQREALRATETRFVAFVRAHEDSYHGYRPYADVGVVWHDAPYVSPSYSREEFIRVTDLSVGLASRGLLWDVVTKRRATAAELSRFRVLVYQDVALITHDEALAVQAFLESGGLVLAAGVVGDVDEWWSMRLFDEARPWPPSGLAPSPTPDVRPRPPSLDLRIGQGRLIYSAAPLSPQSVIASIEDHVGPVGRLSGLSEEETSRIRLGAWIKDDAGTRLTVHVVRYDVPIGQERGGEVVALAGAVIDLDLPPQLMPTAVDLLSPDAPTARLSFTIADRRLTVALPPLTVYAVLSIR